MSSRGTIAQVFYDDEPDDKAVIQVERTEEHELAIHIYTGVLERGLVSIYLDTERDLGHLLANIITERDKDYS